MPQKLQTLRKKYGYSQRQVADKLGVSPSIVSGYETGERTPSTGVLLQLSYLYNCSTDYLLGKKATEPQIIIDTSGLNDNQISAINNLIDNFTQRGGVVTMGNINDFNTLAKLISE